MHRKICLFLMSGLLFVLIASNALALIDKADMPHGGSGFDDAVSITAGTYYFIELSDLSGSNFFGYSGSYQFVAPENGLYSFYGKNITSSSMGISVYNRYQEFVCVTGDDGLAGLASNWFEDSMVYSTQLEQGEVYVVHIRARGKADFAICTPSHHVLPGEWTITKAATCQPGVMTQKCTICGQVVDSRKLEPTGHVPGKWAVTKKATLFQDGEKTRICTVCGEILETEAIPSTGIAPTKFKTEKSKVTIGAGEKFPIEWTVKPINADLEVKAYSSNSKIANTDKDLAFIHAYKPGITTITFQTQNGLTSKIKVTVKPAPSKVTLYKDSKALKKDASLTLKKGKTLQLKAKLPSDTLSTLTWKSDKPKTAKVSKTGKVTALRKGTATVTVRTANGKKAAVKIKVE